MSRQEIHQRTRKFSGKQCTENAEAVSTGGEVLCDGGFLELVRDRRPGTEQLLYWSGGRSSIAPDHSFQARRYRPTDGAAALRHLPSKPTPYGSTERLFTRIREFAGRLLALTEEDSALLAYFCIASFFCDCLPMSPCLLLSGDCIAAISHLRLLGCVCRHPVLLAESNLQCSPRELRPTRLICQPDRGLNRLLAALQFRGFSMVDRGTREISGATAAYIGNMALKSPFADLGLSLALPPSARSFSTADEEREAATIINLQNQLLMYRLKNFPCVRSSNFDVPEFLGSTREIGRVLGQCLVNATQLQSRLLDVLRPRADAERVEGTRKVEAIVVEALVVACHEKRTSVHVGQVASVANAILGRNKECLQLTARETGALLMRLGFRTTRLDSSGRGIYLLTDQCASIHKLGRAFGVPTLRDGSPGCPHCQSK